MQQLRLLKLLLKPSWLSTLMAITLTTVVLGIGNWLYVTRNTFVSEYLFGDFGLVTSLQKSQGNLGQVVIDLFDKPFSYNVIVLLIAVVCGALVYIALESVTRSVDNVQETWEEIHYASGSTRKLVEIELGMRWFIRIAALVSWIVYWILWLSIIIPFCLLASRLLLTDASTLAAWAYGGLGVVVCVASFQLHVVFIRLILLRPRVFGGRRAIELETYDQH